MPAATVESLVERVQAKLGDLDGRYFTVGDLEQHLSSSYEDLERDLAVFQNLELRGRATITVPAGVFEVGPTTAVPLPDDLFFPTGLRERPSGQTTNRWVPMRSISEIDDSIQPTQQLRQWEWRQDSLEFIPATQDVDVEIDYWRSLGAIEFPDDTIEIAHGMELLACRACYWAMVARAQTDPSKLNLATVFNGEYEKGKERLATLHVKQSQGIRLIQRYRFGRSRKRRW